MFRLASLLALKNLRPFNVSVVEDKLIEGKWETTETVMLSGDKRHSVFIIDGASEISSWCN